MAQDDGDRLLAWQEIPAAIRDCIGPALPPGHGVWACPRRTAGGWFRPSRVHIEYWWIDDQGDLIEAFWLE